MLTFRLVFAGVALLGFSSGGLLGYSQPELRPWALDARGVTPRTRVAYALTQPSADATPVAWLELKRDVHEVRAELGADDRALFDLIAAVNGLEAAGRAEWGRAETICRELGFPRCDRGALSSLAAGARGESPR